jgi:hypothetical protein
MIGLVGLLALMSGAWAQETEATDDESTPSSQADEKTESTAPPAAEEAAEELAPDAAEVASPAAAGEAAEEPAPDAAEAPAATGDETDSLPMLEAQAMYRLGLALADKQMWDEACAVYARVEEQHGDTEYAQRAAEHRAMVAQLPEVQTCGVASSADGKGFDLGARSGDVELVVSQAVAGTAFGAALPSLYMPNEMRGEMIAASTLLGLGSGIAGSMVASKRFKVTEGQAMAVFTGEYIGAWNGGALSAILYPFGPPAPATPLQYAVGGFLVGGAAGTAAAIYLEPTAADMALVRSGASWGTGMAALSFTIVYGGNERSDFARMLVGTDVGLVTGALLASKLDVSRGRMNLINLSGYAGGVVAFGVLGTLGLEGLESQVVGGSVLVMSGVGLGVGAHLTRRMDETDSGGTAGVGAEYRDGRWHLGMPIPTVVPVRKGEFGLRLPLASGTF